MSIHHYPLISFQAVSKTYGDDPLDYRSLVLKNVHLDIYPGEFVIVFGASGSGKSTLLNLMAGLEFPTAGKIMVRSRNITKLNSNDLAKYHRLKMGMVFQSFNLIKSLKVWENVALPQAANGIRYGLRRQRAIHLLKLFNIDRYADRRPNEVSGGEQQRVAIARALINNPAFLLVDEPTGNLDTESARDVMNIFKGLHEHGQHTLVLVTHNPDYLSYASRVVYMQDGMVVKQETNAPQALPANELPVKPESLEQLGRYKDTNLHESALEPMGQEPTSHALADAAANTQQPAPVIPQPNPIAPVTQQPTPVIVPRVDKPAPETVEARTEASQPIAVHVHHAEPKLTEPKDDKKESAHKDTHEHAPHSWPLKVPPMLPKAHSNDEDQS